MNKKTEGAAHFSRWAVIAFSAAVMLLSVLKTSASESLNRTELAGFRTDYLMHVVMFIPFMTLFHLRSINMTGKKVWFLPGLIAGSLLAASSEGIQWFLPYRVFNTMDLLANFGGIFVGAVIAGWVKGKR